MVKKILSVALVAIMVLGLSIPAFAAKTPADGVLDATGVYSNSVGSVVADKDAVDLDGVVGQDATQGKTSQYDTVIEDDTRTAIDAYDEAVEVYATKQSTFSVKIPKTIILGSDGNGLFAVEAKGDITGNQTINVVPDADFAMHEVIPGTATPVAAGSAKANITANITMADTAWTYADDFTGGTNTFMAHNGSIAAPAISAGSWAGTFNFAISLVNAAEPTP